MCSLLTIKTEKKGLFTVSNIYLHGRFKQSTNGQCWWSTVDIEAVPTQSIWKSCWHWFSRVLNQCQQDFCSHHFYLSYIERDVKLYNFVYIYFYSIQQMLGMVLTSAVLPITHTLCDLCIFYSLERPAWGAELSSKSQAFSGSVLSLLVYPIHSASTLPSNQTNQTENYLNCRQGSKIWATNVVPVVT